jgi:hypothetical protein
MKRIVLTGAALAALLTGGLAAAAPAMASNGVTAVTHSASHPDTTSVSGTATQPSPAGPVWAYDNLAEQFTVVPVSGLADGANYQVTINVNGSFQGFADPRMASEGSPDPGGPLTSAGSVKGTITYDVSSPVAPDPKGLPAQEPDGTGLGTAMSQLFHGQQQIVGGGAYSYRYNQVGGAPYTQVG